MSKVELDRREVHVIARDIAILGAQMSRAAVRLENLHQALLLAVGRATPERIEGVGSEGPQLEIVPNVDG